MTVVIGFNFPCSHDNAVAAIVDGRLVFAAEEERYSRHKHSIREPPFFSLIKAFEVLGRLGIKPEEVEAFATNYDPQLFPPPWRFSEFVTYTGGSSIPKHLFSWTYHGLNFLYGARSLLKKVYRKMGAVIPANAKIIPVMHHLAHAASAYYFSGFPSSAVLTIDGWGETDSTVIWNVKNGEFEKVASIKLWEGSLGWLYECLSQRLGFDLLEGPGKVMGLAPYGNADEQIGSRFDKIVKIGEGDVPYFFADSFRMKSRAKSLSGIYRMYSRIADFVASGQTLNWDSRKELTESVVNFAWHTQALAEKIVLATAKWTKEQTSENRIALAGGVALNAKANMTLHYSEIYDDLFIFPAANDAGSPLGAAAYVYEHVLGEKMRHGKLSDVYLGSQYDDENVKTTVTKGRWNVEYIGDDVNQVAELLSKGKTVAWYQGRAELGPRALGNRSIVADPTQKDTWRKVNELKGREFWRPLAPSVLDEDKEIYFRKPTEDSFMGLMFEMTKEGCERVPAVCHVDKTARPQTVLTETNPIWYELI